MTTFQKAVTMNNARQDRIQTFSELYRNEKIEVRLVKRREYNEETVRWADAVISAGGMTLWKGSSCFSIFSWIYFSKILCSV